METISTTLPPINVLAPLAMYTARLDDRGRLKLPVPFLTFLETFEDKRLFVTSTDKASVRIYPVSNWLKNEQVLQQNPKAAASVLTIARRWGADAELDSQGRITLKQDLRQALNLESEPLTIYWNRGHVLIMLQSVFDEREKVAMENAAAAMEAVEANGFL